MTNVIKAVRYNFTVADTLLSGYLMPDGSCRLSKTDAVTLIGCDKRRLSQLLEKKVAQTLLPQGLGVVRIPTESGKIDAISISDFCNLCVIALTSGYDQAIAFAGASMAEVIERRFDAAVGIIRSEEERNERFVIRRDGIVSRFFWTDTLDAYIASHDVSDAYKRFIYINVSDAVNKAILGTTAKKYRESLGLPDGVSARDYLTTEQLKQIDTIEKAAGMRVKRDGLCPKQALKDVISLIC